MAIYMLVEGITGSSTDSEHKQWIPIKACDFPVKRPGINTVAGKVTDRLRTSVQFEDITVTKDQDVSSQPLMRWMVDGDSKNVTIAFCKEKGTEILRLTLENTMISDLKATVSGDEQPSETIQLDFTKISMLYKSYDKNNKPVAGPGAVGFDLETATSY
jgi:type VI secretion system secreted protein Hcp